MFERPQFFNTTPLSYDCSFRDKCLKLLDRSGHPTSNVNLWAVSVGDIDASFINGALIVYHHKTIVWLDEGK